MVAKRFYRNLFPTETFDEAQRDWVTSTDGVMAGANQALSYLVFVRDALLFHDRNPELEILFHTPLDNYLRYLISGGLNFWALLPHSVTPFVRFCEKALFGLHKYLALYHVVVVRKRTS